MAATKAIELGANVAFLTQPHSWVLGKVSAYDAKNKTYTCTTKDPEPMMVDKVKHAIDAIWAPRMEYLEEDVDDLLRLVELHEASLLFCLKKRYFKDVVYTNIGPIVVALNPFTREIPWYKDEKMHDYLQEGVVIERSLPHSWAVAHNTYYEMVENRQNQTILVSGESGAGKTEAAKIVVKYLGALSTKNGTREQQLKCEAVNAKVNAASPILEAFGNAKTVRNDNSSRFGKFAKIQFDRDGFLVGCFAIKYLLEKSRIVSAAKDERVYHSFYQLAQGEDAKQYGIRNPNVYRVLGCGGCITIDGVDDAQDFATTKAAMLQVGIAELQEKSIWRIVAGIMFLQNLDFTEVEEKSGKVAKIDPSLQSVIPRAAELWKINAADIEKELVSLTISARGESTVKLFSKAQAQDSRDTVCKSLYDWLFDWLVRRINITTDQEAQTERWIGLLDIFGFEDFTRNSFEQLCINLANETLQNHYNWFIFTEDMKECHEEGINVEAVTFIDNKPCIDLLIGKGGVFSTLDDECAINGNEKNLLTKLNEKYLSTKQKEGNAYWTPVTGKAMDNHFRIRHYAADVQYCIDGMMDKNRDTLKDAMRLVLSRSEDELVRAIVPVVDETARPTAKVTVGGYFTKQLQELMALINSTNPHWIRCIKPHMNKQPRNFSHLAVMTQLRSAGVLDTVKVRKAGYPIRFKNELFLKRYRILVAPGDVEKDARTAIGNMFKALGITIATGQLGKNKVFLRQDAFSALNHAKDEATAKYSLIFQSVGRASVQRDILFKAYVQMHRARILAERKAREEALQRLREEEERRRRAEEEERKKREGLEKQARYRSAVTIQRHVRGFLTRQSVVRYYIESLRAVEERSLEAEFDKYRGYFYAQLDRRVSALELRHFQFEKMKSKLAETEDRHLLRRQKQQQQREQTMLTIADNTRQLTVQRDKELKAERAKQKEVLEDKRAKRLEQDLRAREKKRQLQAMREVQEEQALAQLERRLADDRSKRQTMAETEGDVDALFAAKARVLYTQTHPEARMDSADFEQAKEDWALREQWEANREARFAYDRQKGIESRSRWEKLVSAGNGSMASSAAAAGPAVRTMRFPPSAAASPSRSAFAPPPPATVLSPQERRLEAAYRQRVLQQVEHEVETRRLLAELRPERT